MADLRMLEHNYPKDSRAAFEDLCTLLFCTELGLSHGVNRRVNQRGVESDPVRINGRVYAYQAKYYDASTRLGDRKGDLAKAIDAAREEGVTDLLLFVNKDLPDRNADGSEAKLMRDLEAAAQGGVGAPEVRLHWWSRSKIETTLDMDGYGHARRSFLGEGRGTRLAAYYDYVCKRFRDDNGSELYGEIPLRECYIEPKVEDGRGDLRDVRDFVESWVDKGDTIAVICGEPGHGKTSLCRKAVYDFHKSGWLASKVTNVFHFSLNPANTDAIKPDGSLDLYSLLSWGNNRRNPNHRIDEEDCRGALVFLDGFDELLEWHPRVGLEGFIEDYVAGFQRDTGARVVITIRNMALDPETPDTDISSDGWRFRVVIRRMQPISMESQLWWIDRCIDYFRQVEINTTDTVTWAERDRAGLAAAQLENYLDSYRQLHVDETLQAILGIPIIFRMVVAARYIPRADTSIVRIYDDLFEITWKRHRHSENGLTMGAAKARLSWHALKVFLDKGDTAVVKDPLRSPWSFSFYTTHKGGSRVGFVHRSFYQYFLAHEIVSWLREYAKYEDVNALRARLAYLARRQLDITTLGYIRDIHDGERNKDSLARSFHASYKALKETDGMLPLPPDDKCTVWITETTPLERANNVFWNTVSVCEICGHRTTADKVNAKALRSYDLSGCILSGAQLNETDLCRADLREAHLNGANLSGAILSGADLCEAHLYWTHLDGSDLRRSSLHGAHLDEANLVGADLSGADLSGAYLRRAHLNGACLDGANMCGANFQGMDHSGASFNEVRVFRTDLRRAALTESSLPGAIILDG